MNIINRKNKLKGPEKVIISSTDKCNLNCKMCWRHDKKDDPNKTKNELTFDEIKKIIIDAKKLDVKTIDLTGGGEPFLRKDIFDLIEMIKYYGFETTLTTNSTLLDKKKVETLIQLGLDDICFSIETLDEETNDSLRGQGTTQKIIEVIKLFNQTKNELNKKNPKLRLATVITNKNYKKLDSLVEFAIKNNIEAINFSVLIEWSSCKDLSMEKVEWAESKNIFEDLDKKLKKNNIYSNLSSIIKHGLSSHSFPKFCYAPWEILFINSRGEVLPCCILASYYSIVIGNIRKNSLKEIWFGKKMEDFRNKIRKGEYFEKCKYCLPEFVDIYNEKFEKSKKS
jgi:radical SAM protein with 4Fe4S-binding SPASM domain